LNDYRFGVYFNGNKACLKNGGAGAVGSTGQGINAAEKEPAPRESRVAFAVPLIFLARLAGFEPAAYGLEVRCSIQLSYRR
jgi:hypothetical protein